ncbi:MAG: hypothetical protein HY963_03235 [Ignavibacteriales bacterium]|nr:hypothetical protein [Ignavibacteriales bacterium]
MKVFLVLFLVISISINGQNAATQNLLELSGDSVNIRAMVQKQINFALEKRTESKIGSLPALEEKIKVLADKMNQAQAEPRPTFFNFLLSQPLYYKLFATGSFLILFFFVLKRILTNLNRKSISSLKNNIGMMREEKIGGGKQNPKLVRIRKALKEKIEIFMRSEKHLSKTAKQLNVAKGELMLAAKLKILEVEKMQGA